MVSLCNVQFRQLERNQGNAGMSEMRLVYWGKNAISYAIFNEKTRIVM